MENINKLGRMSEIIGKGLFYVIIIFLSIAGVVMCLTRLENKPGTINIIAVLVGTIIAISLFYFLIRFLFRPIYNLNKNIQLKIGGQLTQNEFKNKWAISLICSLLFGLLFILGTFGLSLLLMIPHYILLNKSRTLWTK
jgi:arginine exporter protein ArgO